MTEVQIIVTVVVGLVSAVLGGLIGGTLTLGRVTGFVHSLREDKPWEAAIQALYKSTPVPVQTTVREGVDLLNEIDGLAQDVTAPEK